MSTEASYEDESSQREDEFIDQRAEEHANFLQQNHHPFQLPNGLQVIYQRFPGALVSYIVLGFRISDTIQQKQQGLAHFIEHLLARWINTNSAILIQERYMTACQGLTDFDSIRLQCSVDNDHLQVVLRCLSSVFEISREILTQSAFDEEREAILVELEHLEQDISSRIRKQALSLLFSDISYGVGDAAGLTESVSTVTLEAVTQYYRANITHSNSSLVIVGDLGEANLVAELVLASFRQ